MPTCDNCGGHITPDFQRVFSGNTGRIQGCPNCMDTVQIIRGEPAERTENAGDHRERRTGAPTASTGGDNRSYRRGDRSDDLSSMRTSTTWTEGGENDFTTGSEDHGQD